ncbi:MAG: hypothetical protein ABSF17_00680 [Terracidiphilus sp.]|jgi:opacity protein-like surface antigen
MSYSYRVSAIMVVSACALAASAQATDPQSNQVTPDSSSPVAYVYVTRPTHIDGFAAAANGQLTAVPGSPYAGIGVNSLSVNTQFLFGGDDNGASIDTFKIASNGSLEKVASENTTVHNPDPQAPIGPIQIDSAGKTIYVEVVNSDTAGYIQSYKIESNGSLQYLGNVSEDIYYGEEYPLGVNLEANDKFAYQGSNVDFDDTEDGGILIYKRGSNGLLENSTATANLPPTHGSEYVYTVDSLAMDPSNHMAAAIVPLDGEFSVLSNDVLASYTIASNGDATTSSTYKNMPVTDLFPVSETSISPSGKLLAVGGQGFQVFHFNGSEPITHYSGLLQSGTYFLEFGWDKANHLYALGIGKLFVYTVTPTSITEAPGSPYSIPEASSVIVLSK